MFRIVIVILTYQRHKPINISLLYSFGPSYWVWYKSLILHLRSSLLCSQESASCDAVKPLLICEPPIMQLRSSLLCSFLHFTAISPLLVSNGFIFAQPLSQTPSIYVRETRTIPSFEIRVSELSSPLFRRSMSTDTMSRGHPQADVTWQVDMLTGTEVLQLMGFSASEMHPMCAELIAIRRLAVVPVATCACLRAACLLY
jgi:hypothetical protein